MNLPIHIKRFKKTCGKWLRSLLNLRTSISFISDIQNKKTITLGPSQVLLLLNWWGRRGEKALWLHSKRGSRKALEVLRGSQPKTRHLARGALGRRTETFPLKTSTFTKRESKNTKTPKPKNHVRYLGQGPCGFESRVLHRVMTVTWLDNKNKKPNAFYGKLLKFCCKSPT